MTLPSIPAWRLGKPYDSLDRVEVRDHRSGAAVASVGQVNGGIIRRDLKRVGEAAAALRRKTTAQMIAVCEKAGELFLGATLDVPGIGAQTPDAYVAALSSSSALPHALCRRNMAKIHAALTRMGAIVRGLTRGLDTAILDRGVGEQAGAPTSFFPVTDALGVVLPSNSPGVNSIWLPALALRTPVILKPGREEPWTPLRLIAALIAAGCPPEAVGFYPTDHEGSQAILQTCGRAILFGDDNTIRNYAANPAIQCHGTGRSKVILGEDVADRWRDFVDVIVASISDNGGRSCINASCVITPRHADALADEVAKRLAAIPPRKADDPAAVLSPFANPAFAEAIDGLVTQGLAAPGAEDVTARHRPGPRKALLADGPGQSTFLLPTLVRCASIEHPLGNTEFLFPFAGVLEIPQRDVLAKIGPSLVVTAVTHDPTFIDAILRCPHIDRLNLGPVPTSRVEWDQPHEGNLFEFLYRRRAIHTAPAW